MSRSLESAGSPGITGGTNKELVSRSVFTVCAALVIVVMAAIFLFVGLNAYQTFTVDHINPLHFFTQAQWSPDFRQVGSLALIIGSFVVTVLAVLLSTPISVGIAIFVAEIAPPWAGRVMRPALELLTGIPSIVYGFLGLLVIVPLIPRVYNSITGGPYLASGFDALAAAIVLTVMILPTITTISVDALSALPQGLREASLALGATKWQTIRRTLIPAASSGILTGVILGMGRAIGETLAVSFVIGSNANLFPIRFTDIYPYVQLPPTSTIVDGS